MSKTKTTIKPFNWLKKLLRKKTVMSLFTKRKSSNSPLSPQELQDIQSSISLLRNLDEISIAKFKKAYCENDLSVLIISGQPSEKQLSDAWLELLLSYSSAMKTESNEYKLDLMRSIGLLQAEIIYIENAVFLLRHRYDPDVAHELIKMGYDLPADPKDDKGWTLCLDRIISFSKTKVYDLEQLTDEYKRMDKTTTGKKLTVEEFDKNVAMISRYMRYRIDQEKTMMTEYQSYLNAYIQEMNWKSKKQIPNEEEG